MLHLQPLPSLYLSRDGVFHHFLLFEIRVWIKISLPRMQTVKVVKSIQQNANISWRFIFQDLSKNVSENLKQR